MPEIIRSKINPELRKRINPSAEIPGFEAGDECCVASGGNPRVSKRTAYNIVTKKKGAPDFSPGGSTFEYMKKVLIVIFILITVLFFIGKEDVVMAKEIQLPRAVTMGKISLEEAIAKRRSERSFSKKELALEQISQLLWAAQGITGAGGGRSAPSAGALYPMEIYALTKNGLYHYLPDKHALEVLNEKDLRSDLASASLGQSSVSAAALDIVICAVYERITSKYGERGERYTDIEAGHIAQNIHLQAVVLGLGSVPIGAFNDDQVKSALNLPEDQVPLYIIPVGYAK